MDLQLFKDFAAVGTIITGLISLIRPEAVLSFTGLRPEGGRGITEIRAVLGALFVGLGAAPLLLAEPAAYQALGIGYLTVGAVRTVSMFIDNSVVRSNVISIVFELVFGLVLVF